MMFPEARPGRASSIQAIGEAMMADDARIYLDANISIHCFEMSRSACDELLSALEALGARVRVSLWTAKETWERTLEWSSKTPLDTG